jgi:uncharacterized protein (TIGR02611 family)
LAAERSSSWFRFGRRILIAIAGGAVVAVGVVLAVPLVPGPGLVIIALGLGILSLEFERPRIWLASLKQRARELAQRVRRKSPGSDGK